MAGAPQEQQPYGQQYQPMPQFAPPMGRRPGSVAPIVWGIILLVLGFIGLLLFLVNIASLGGGMSGSSFTNVSPEGKAEIDRLTDTIVKESMARWSFWLYHTMELVVVALSLAAGFLLCIRPRPLGRKLALARVAMAFVLIPVYGYETAQSMEGITGMQDQMMQISIDDQLAKREKENPSKNEAERERRRDEMQDAVGVMQPMMKGFVYGTMIAVIVTIMIINSLLLFFMTRPAVKDYLESVAAGGDNSIPGYDPSMGLVSGPPQPPPMQ